VSIVISFSVNYSTLYPTYPPLWKRTELVEAHITHLVSAISSIAVAAKTTAPCGSVKRGWQGSQVTSVLIEAKVVHITRPGQKTKMYKVNSDTAIAKLSNNEY
jgi:hypothetical protein